MRIAGIELFKENGTAIEVFIGSSRIACSLNFEDESMIFEATFVILVGTKIIDAQATVGKGTIFALAHDDFYAAAHMRKASYVDCMAINRVEYYTSLKNTLEGVWTTFTCLYNIFKDLLHSTLGLGKKALATLCS